jgi:RNA polymerase sigma factor (sigma-70 family)
VFYGAQAQAYGACGGGGGLKWAGSAAPPAETLPDARTHKNPSPIRQNYLLYIRVERFNVPFMGEPQEALNAWFKREILVHETMLFRYLLRVWPRKHEVPDLRQETYARVYQAAGLARPASPRSFLFTTAHNLMADRIRHERVVSIEAVGDIDALNVSVDELSTEDLVSTREELKRAGEALDRLPPRCREVVWLRRVEGLSQREAAAALGISVKAIEQHMSKGMRLLATYMLSERGAGSDEIEHDRQAQGIRNPRNDRERG